MISETAQPPFVAVASVPKAEFEFTQMPARYLPLK
jgi:hypothetical protein